MVFYSLALLLSVAAIYAQQRPTSSLQPTSLWLFALTSLFLGLVSESNWAPIFVLRYFFYVISGFAMALIPLLLLALGVLNLSRLPKEDLSRGRYWLNIVLSLAFIVFALYSLSRWRFLNENMALLIQVHIMLGLYITANFISYILINIAVAIMPLRSPVEILVVLGARIEDNQVSKVLQYRLDKAYQFYRQHKDPARLLMIVTGGLDPRYSDISEAEAMKGYLVDRGIPPEQIVAEEKATNTSQNMAFTQELMAERGLEESPVIITSYFHLLRSYYLARHKRFPARFIGARSPIWSWPYAFVREYMAYLVLIKEYNYLYITLLIIYSAVTVLN